MMIMQLDNAWTLVAAMATILLGMRIHRVLPMLDRANIPPAVSAGLLLSVLLALLRAGGIVDVRLATVPRDVLLLVFFASLGFGAHLGRLATAGKSALVICLAVVLVAVGQNLAGMLLASAFGQPAVLGLFAGSAARLHRSRQPPKRVCRGTSRPASRKGTEAALPARIRIFCGQPYTLRNKRRKREKGIFAGKIPFSRTPVAGRETPHCGENSPLP